jgi:hypothetical protein
VERYLLDMIEKVRGILSRWTKVKPPKNLSMIADYTAKIEPGHSRKNLVTL